MKSKKISKAKRAGLSFSVRKTENTMRTVCKKNKSYDCILKVSSYAGVYLTAVVEYLSAEIIEAGGIKTRKDKRKTILISDIIHGIQNDTELNAYIFGVNTPSTETLAGVCPCGVSKVPSDLTKSMEDIKKEISHENFYHLDKNRIITEASLRRVLKEINPDLHIKKNAIEYLIVLIQNIADSISNLAMYLSQYVSRQRTLDARLIQNAVRASIPVELAKHAVSEGTRAVTKYTSY